MSAGVDMHVYVYTCMHIQGHSCSLMQACLKGQTLEDLEKSMEKDVSIHRSQILTGSSLFRVTGSPLPIYLPQGLYTPLSLYYGTQVVSGIQGLKPMKEMPAQLWETQHWESGKPLLCPRHESLSYWGMRLGKGFWSPTVIQLY